MRYDALHTSALQQVHPSLKLTDFDKLRANGKGGERERRICPVSSKVHEESTFVL